MEREREAKTDDDIQLGSIDYYFNKNRFVNLLLKTQKYKDLWKSKEALASLILSLITTIFLLTISSSISTFEDITKIVDNIPESIMLLV